MRYGVERGNIRARKKRAGKGALGRKKSLNFIKKRLDFLYDL